VVAIDPGYPLMFAAESGWISRGWRSPRLCSSPEACLSASPTSWHFPISSLGPSFSSFSFPSLTLLRSAEKCNDPEERFLRVLQYYLAGWHIKPKGVKKPCVFFTLSLCV